MGISSIVLKCNGCGYEGNTHIIIENNSSLAVCARCYAHIKFVPKGALTGNKCCYCERAFNNDNKTKEHIIPQTVGGSSHPYNISWCCNKCNQWRGNKPYIQWAREVEPLINIGRGVYYQPIHIQNILKNIEQIQDSIYLNLNEIYK